MSTTFEKLKPLEIKAYRCLITDSYFNSTCGAEFIPTSSESPEEVKARADKHVNTPFDKPFPAGFVYKSRRGEINILIKKFGLSPIFNGAYTHSYRQYREVFYPNKNVFYPNSSLFSEDQGLLTNSKHLREFIHGRKASILSDSIFQDFLAKFEEMKNNPRKYQIPKSLDSLTLINQVPDDVLNWTP